MRKFHFFAVLLAVLALVSACGGPRTLMPTPKIYADDQAVLFDELPDIYESTRVELIYITDRVPEQDEDGNLRYGYQRSQSLAAGKVVVDLGANVSWGELVQASRSNTRIKDFNLSLESIEEIVRLPPDPVPFELVGGKVVEDREIVAQTNKIVRQLQSEIRRRLAETPRKDVYLYVHGYHNTFEDAAFTLAELWHFFGREGLPVVYTWPAGQPGIFGYTYDRESSEFTVFHLKDTIRWLAAQPQIENIHLIAHSRGTDVAVSAFRELVLVERSAGRDPRKTLKIKNLVIAAPDIDLQVLSQRVSSEYLGLAVGQATLYTSPEDRAIGLAARLFNSPRGRLGNLSVLNASEQELRTLERTRGQVSVVNFEEKSSGYGHDYFRTNPSVSSDLVLTIRYGLRPGDPGRPLVPDGPSFWKIPPDYPNTAAPN